MKELLFEINDFNEPATMDNIDADALLLHNVIIGRSDSHVTEGVGFNIRKYRFKDLKASLSEITSKLRLHCEKYIPNIYIDSITADTTTGENIVLLINMTNTITHVSKNIYFNIEKTEIKMLVDVMN